MNHAAGSPANLIVPRNGFSADLIASTARELGFAQPNTLEALVWDYELYAQLQQRGSGSFRLKGGAAVQLYVPAERQRASMDIDVLTAAPRRKIQELLQDISTAYAAEEPYLRFEPYVPDRPASIRGLYSYTTLAPSTLGQKWRLEDGTIVEARMIKVDFHETENLPPGEKREGTVAEIRLGYQPICVRRGYLIAEKLLTQARGTVGVPDARYPDLPKHLYDLDSLMMSPDTVEALTEASVWLPGLIEQQGDRWKGEKGIEAVLNDLETSLLNLAVIDYGDEREKYGRAVQSLETLYLPSGARMKLHRWATIAARVLAIVRLLRSRITGEEVAIRSLYSMAERLAGEVRSHPKSFQLTRTLCERLPAPLLSVRQLRGSPPERLFWLLVDWDNLDHLEEIIARS